MIAKTKPISMMGKDADAIFHAGLAAVDPEKSIYSLCSRVDELLAVGSHTYELDAFNNIYVIGAGKASAPMGAAIERLLGDRLTSGTINVKYGHTRPLSKIKLVEAGHPLPDKNGATGTRKILDIARESGEKDLIICLISGGGSALMPLPAEGISLEDKQETMRVLMACGATIIEINTLRKHMSAIKGGQLSRAAYPATIISLIISDVVGNDPATIASGPTVPDPGTYQDCQRIINKYQINSRLPESVLRHLACGMSGDRPETPKKNDPALKKTRNLVCADNMKAILAARHQARQLGYETIILSSMIEGETRDVARMHAAIARETLASGNPVNPPACILSGGETTVTIHGQGVGGRNQEFCLAMAGDIADKHNIFVLSGGTDGTDGPTDAAGAVMHAEVLKKATALGLDAQTYLDNNDAYTFFKQTGGLLMTGPTRTNVMDLRIMLIT